MNILKVTWENFKRLMLEFGWEIVKGTIYISVGVAFVGFAQNVEPKSLIEANELGFAQLILGVSLAMAVFEFAAKWVWQNSEPDEAPAPAPEPAPTPEDARA